jgi:hypothetical protein
MTTATTARIRRCRMRNRLDNPCPNPALSDDEKTIAICAKHAAKVMELINEQARRS